jgi:CoA:oxalate CoA-transferase
LASTSGFGQTGPYANRPAYDIVAQGMGGIMSMTGHPGGPPTRVGTSLGDIAAGLFTAIGVEAALLERERSGGGMHVDVAMLDSQVAILENAIARYAATGRVPGPLGSRHPSSTPFDALETRDGYVIVAAGNDALFGALCRALDCAELAGQVLNDPQVTARNMVVTVDGDDDSAMRVAGNPIKLSAFEDPPRRGRAPELDADRDRIVAELKK